MFDDFDGHEEAFKRAVEDAAYDKHIGRALPQFDPGKLVDWGACANESCMKPYPGCEHGAFCSSACRADQRARWAAEVSDGR